MKSLCLFVVWMYCVQQALCLAKPRITCPLYVPENKSTTCWCEKPEDVQENVTLWWSYNSGTNKLLLRSVQREDNGSQYYCNMKNGRKTALSLYTLRVAYGPYSEHLHVSPEQFVSNGSQTFNVTCIANDTYPTPSYTWSGITCENTTPDNTCTFTPGPSTDYFRVLTCTAKASVGIVPVQASKTLSLKFYYPPLQKPVILPTPAKHDLLPGDNITCTVTGGRPPVKSVHFYCLNPFLPDENDTRSETSVSSSLTVNSSLVSVKNMTCYCNATWKKKPEYYQHVSTAVYNGEETPGKDYAYYPLGLVAGVFALPFFATVIALFTEVRKRLHYRRCPTNNPNTENPRNDRISFAGPERVSLLASDSPGEHVPCSPTLPTPDNNRDATAELPTASSDTESVQMDVHPSETSPSRRQSQPSLAATAEGLNTDDVYSIISKATGSGTQRSLLAATEEDLDTDAVYGNIPKEVYSQQKPSPRSEESEQPLAGEGISTDDVNSTITKATGSGTQRSLLAATEEDLDTDAVYGNIPKEIQPQQKPPPRSEESEQPSAGEDLNTDDVYSTVSKATGSGTQRSLFAATAEGLDTDAVYGNMPKEGQPQQKPSPCSEGSELPFAGVELDTDAVYCTINKSTASGAQRSLLVGERPEPEGSRLGEDRGEDHKEHAELGGESNTAASSSCQETKAGEQAPDEEEVYNALSYTRHNTLSASDVYDRICFNQANNKQENTPRRKSHE